MVQVYDAVLGACPWSPLSPVYVHFLRRPRGLVVGDLCRHAERDDEGYDATRDVHRRVGLVGARVVGFAGRGR